MARDHRYVLLLPIGVFGLFILSQCILQRYSSLLTKRLRYIPQTIHEEEIPQTRFVPGHNKFHMTPIWQELIDSQLPSSSDMEQQLQEKNAAAGPLTRGVHNLDVEAMDKEERDFWLEQYTRQERPEEEAERLRKSPYIHHEKEELQRLSSPVVQKEMKYIAFYFPFDRTQNSFKMCRYSRCSYTKSFSQAHVVAFKAAFLRDHGLPVFNRPPYQKWVMHTSDPASKNFGLNKAELNFKFNATCTYRLNSDISWMFGRLRKVDPPIYDYGEIFDAKEDLAAWFVSHCETLSQREEYVRRMQKIINVKIFGLCNNVTCGNYNYRMDDTTPCLPLLSQKFKFYLSFENSFCEDYVTEKFFKLFHNTHVIPVVRGGVDYNKLFPSGIFINTADFKTPEDLARHLLYLGSDKKRYVQMLRKKARWTVSPAGELKHCKLCEYAHTKTTPKFYPNLKEVFNGDYPHCWKPIDIQQALSDIH